jgi:hypothetical protein
MYVSLQTEPGCAFLLGTRLCGQNPLGILSLPWLMRCWTSATHPTADPARLRLSDFDAALMRRRSAIDFTIGVHYSWRQRKGRIQSSGRAVPTLNRTPRLPTFFQPDSEWTPGAIARKVLVDARSTRSPQPGAQETVQGSSKPISQAILKHCGVSGTTTLA